MHFAKSHLQASDFASLYHKAAYSANIYSIKIESGIDNRIHVRYNANQNRCSQTNVPRFIYLSIFKQMDHGRK